MRHHLRLVAIAGLVVALAGCSSDSDADPATTLDVTTPPATDPSTTSSTSTTTSTLPPTTTTSPEQVKAEVAAAFVELEDKVLAVQMSPSLENLDSKATEIAVPASPFYDVVKARVQELVANGQFVALNQPDIRSLTVEEVELLGDPPFALANVTVCQVTNTLVMKGPENTTRPGSTIPVAGTGQLVAYRYTQSLRRTDAGWRHEGVADPSDPFWEGLSECPAS